MTNARGLSYILLLVLVKSLSAMRTPSASHFMLLLVDQILIQRSTGTARTRSNRSVFALTSPGGERQPVERLADDGGAALSALIARCHSRASAAERAASVHVVCGACSGPLASALRTTPLPHASSFCSRLIWSSADGSAGERSVGVKSFRRGSRPA